MKKKALLLTLSAAALVAASVFGTYAYLTDTEAVTNTFTVGQVGITLDEAPVDKDGKETTGERVIANEYHLLPGHEYDKDPTVHVDKDSEDCYVFVKVENGISAIEAQDNTSAQQIEDNDWKKLSDVENVYYKKWEKGNGLDLVVFKKFKIDGKVDNATIAKYASKDANGKDTGVNIKVTAYAVQADGFATALEAWNTALK